MPVNNKIPINIHFHESGVMQLKNIQIKLLMKKTLWLVLNLTNHKRINTGN